MKSSEAEALQRAVQERTGGLSWDRLGRVGGRLYTKRGSMGNSIFTCI